MNVKTLERKNARTFEQRSQKWDSGREQKNANEFMEDHGAQKRVSIGGVGGLELGRVRMQKYFVAPTLKL